MPRPLFVSAILGLVVTVTLAPSIAARAADDCSAGPKYAAPQGSHWYYRVDRASGRHCWFLGAAGAKIRSSAKAQAADKPSAPPAAATAGERPAPQNFFEAIASDDPAERFSTRWPEQTQALSADPPPAAIGNSYADEPDRREARDEAPSAASAVPASSAAAAPPARTSGVAPVLAILAGAALAAVAAGTLLKRFAVPRSALDRRGPAANAVRVDEKPSPAFARPVASARQPGGVRPPPADIDRPPLKPSDPNLDIEQSLQRLLHSWQRVAA